MYSLIVYFLISCISIIYSFHLFINYLRIYYLLYYSFIRILLFTHTYFTIHLYIFYYSRIRSLLFIYTYFTIHLYIFYYSLFTIYHLPFIIYHLLSNIYYLLLTIYYLGKNPYLMEFDKTPIFWCSCVAHDAWINLTFCSDQF